MLRYFAFSHFHADADSFADSAFAAADIFAISHISPHISPRRHFRQLRFRCFHFSSFVIAFHIAIDASFLFAA